MTRWSEANAIYQIYPRSFQDSNSDGVGDIPGIIERLAYLKGLDDSLGVDAIWLSPLYPSPMKDFGYDVSDYCDINPLFGDLAAFDHLVAEAHARDIRVMIDFVPNHTSSQHPWFIDACRSRDSDKRGYYLFRDPQPDGSPPNNWLSVFGGSAWEYHESTGQYYLHSFLKDQPDLDWSNPQVQDEMRHILRFWFDRGVDGIRADAIRWMGKNTDLADDPINDSYEEGQDPYHSVEHRYSRFSPELNKYLRVMTSVADEYDNKIVIFEDHIDTLSPVESQVRRIYSINPRISAPFNFQPMHIEASSRSFSSMITQYQSYLPKHTREYYCFSSHDESRFASRFGDNMTPAMTVLQLTLPGTPVLYYGQEIGMKDVPIAPNQVQDPFELRVPSKGLGRDPQRTPMQWDATPQAGFSNANTTWLPVADNHVLVNVAAQQGDPASLLGLHKQLLKLRKEYPVLQHGTYEHVYTDDDVFVFRLSGENTSFITAINFREYPVVVDIPPGGTVKVSARTPALYEKTTDSTLKIAPFDGLTIQYES